MVLKINGMFEARRGKKRMKRVSQSTESNSGRGENYIMTADHRTDYYLFVPFVFHSEKAFDSDNKSNFYTNFCTNLSLVKLSSR